MDNRTGKKSTGCPFCRPSPTKVCYHNSLAHLKPDLMKEWDYDKNKDIDPSKLPVSSRAIVAWRCPKTCQMGCKHEWTASIRQRTTKSRPTGCPYCAPHPKAVCEHGSFKYLYPELMKQWDFSKNKDIDPGKLAPCSNVRAHWICNEAECGCIHEWQTCIQNRTMGGHGCSWCSPCPLHVCIHNSLEFKYPEIAKEWDTSKNGILKPSEVSCGSQKKVWWKCRKMGHKWKTCISSRTGSEKTGCPFCRNKTQNDLFDWLTEQFPNYTIKPEKTFGWCRGITSRSLLRHDFYIVELNRIIELDGPQHFKDISNWEPCKDIRIKDIRKMKIAHEHDIPVIRITQTMFKKRKAEMIDLLLPHILDEELEYVFLCEDNEYRTHKAMLTKALKNN